MGNDNRLAEVKLRGFDGHGKKVDAFTVVFDANVGLAVAIVGGVIVGGGVIGGSVMGLCVGGGGVSLLVVGRVASGDVVA